MAFGYFLPTSLDSDIGLSDLEKEFSPIDIDAYSLQEDSSDTILPQRSSSISFNDDGSKFYTTQIPQSGSVQSPTIREYNLGTNWSVENFTLFDTLPFSILSDVFISSNSNLLGYPYSRINTAMFKDGGSKMLIASNKPSANSSSRYSNYATIGCISYDDANDYYGVDPSSYTTSIHQSRVMTEKFHQGFSKGIQFSSDGTKLFSLLSPFDAILEYPLGTAWDISTVGSLTTQLDISGSIATGEGFKFNDDGTKVFVCGPSSSVYGWDLSTAYDLSNSSTGTTQNFTSQISSNTIYDIVFADSGFSLFITTDLGTHAYDLSSAYDLTTTSYSDVNSNILAMGLRFSPDGHSLYGVTQYWLYSYELSTAYDITSLTDTVKLFYVHDGQYTKNPHDLEFGNNGTILYIVTPNAITEYPLDQAYYPAEGSMIHTGIVTQTGFSIDGSDDGTTIVVSDNAYINSGVDTIDAQGSVLKTYTLSTPWDFSTMKFTRQYRFETATHVRFSFNQVGNRIFLVSGTSSKNIHILHLSTPWDTSSVYKEESVAVVNNPTTAAIGFAIGENGKRLYYHDIFDQNPSIHHYGTFPNPSFSNFYRGGKFVPDNNYFRALCTVPESGPISYQDFYPTKSYTLSSLKDSSDEGQSFNVTVSGNGADGTVVSYSVAGISDSDLTSGSLTGDLTLSAGTASATFALLNDVLIEGDETFVFSLDDIELNPISIIINDTSRQFANYNFSNPNVTGTSGVVTSLHGWDIHAERVILTGNSRSTIGGFTAPLDTTAPSNAPSTAPDAQNVTSGNYSYEILESSDDISGSPSGKPCIRLLLTSGNTVSYGIMHGPYVIADEYTNILSGQTVSFEWRAAAGADAYDVYAYLLKDDGSTQLLLDQTQGGTSGDSGWISASATVASSGNYKFVFVSGTYDFSGGEAVGASLYVTNISIA